MNSFHKIYIRIATIIFSQGVDCKIYYKVTIKASKKLKQYFGENVEKNIKNNCKYIYNINDMFNPIDRFLSYTNKNNE